MDTKKNGYRETHVKNQKNTQTIKVEIHDNPTHKGVAVIDGVWVKVGDGKENRGLTPKSKQRQTPEDSCPSGVSFFFFLSKRVYHVYGIGDTAFMV